MEQRWIERPPLEAGKLILIKASMVASASPWAQGAVIAERCSERGLNPIILADALLADEPTLNHIAHQANIRHRKAGKGPTNLNRRDLVRIIGIDFPHAADLLDLSSDQLRSIYGSTYQSLVAIHGRSELLEYRLSSIIQTMKRSNLIFG